MPAHDEDRWFTWLRACTADLAAIVDGDLDRPVPTCPGWTFRQLAIHLGRGHRWAAQIVATRATAPVPVREVADGKLPEDPARHAPWLNAGAEQVIQAVAAADGDLVWTMTGMRPASFWARRRAHEAAVHLADAQLAAGRDVELARTWPRTALTNGSVSSPLAPGAAPPRRGNCAETARACTFTPPIPAYPAPASGWSPGPRPASPSSTATAKPMSPSAGPRLACCWRFLTRRLPPSAPGLEILGEQALLTHWLEHSLFSLPVPDPGQPPSRYHERALPRKRLVRRFTSRFRGNASPRR